MDYYVDRMDDLIRNDTIFPAQFADLVGRSKTLTPELSLMWAILADAIHCATAPEPMSNHHRRLHYEAENWILVPSRPGSEGCTLDFVCEALGLDPAAVRQCYRAGRIVRPPKHMHVSASRRSRKITVA